MAAYRKRYYLSHPRQAYREFVYWPIRNRRQLVRRGWADTDTWGLDHTLCLRLGAQLLHLADTAHGWPGDDEFPTYEDWTTALRANGQALLDYAKRPGQGELTSKWHDLKFGKDPGSDWLSKINSEDDEPTKVAWTELISLGERLDAAGQEALHWVADHLGSLWD